MSILSLTYPKDELAHMTDEQRVIFLKRAFAVNMINLDRWEIVEGYSEKYRRKTITIQEIEE